MIDLKIENIKCTYQVEGCDMVILAELVLTTHTILQDLAKSDQNVLKRYKDVLINLLNDSEIAYDVANTVKRNKNETL